MASRTKLPSGEWKVRWRDGGKRAGKGHSRTCPTARIANDLIADIEAAHSLGRVWVPPASVEIPRLTTLIDRYLLDLCRVSAQATVNSHRSQLEGFLRWCIAESRDDGSALSRSLVESYDAHRLSLPRPPKVSTRRLYLGIIAGWWRWCAEHEDWRGMVPPVTSVRMPPRVIVETIAPLWAEVDALLASAKRRVEEAATRTRPAPIWRAVYRLAVLMRATGLRLSQCLRLEWRDLDCGLGTVRIRPELGKSAQERAGRTLPLPPWLIAEVLAWEEDAGRSGLLVWVPAEGRDGIEDGTRVAMPETTGAWRMRQLWTELRIDGQPVRPELYQGRPDHAFRKALRTECVAARCNSDAIEYWCGRSIGQRGTYTDPRVHELVQIARAIPCPPCVLGVYASGVSVLASQPAKRLRRAS